ncbi:MAG: hypothetical protein ACXQT5_04835 [Candidatus Syntropharchaeia archaeon]
MKEEHRLIIGVGMFLTSTALEIFWSDIDDLVITILMVGSITLIVSVVYRHVRYRELPEREDQAKTLAIVHSWWITMIFMAVIIWFYHLDLLDITPTEVLGLVFFVMVLSALIFWMYFGKRGLPYKNLKSQR